ncbi:MAG: Trk system potassium transporter TrkA [Clostridia bacterium]|nr:Trk system potassium transporter TrkA [Clostridia bacterium]
MKIIIIGAGKVGRSLAESLSSENHEVTVVDTNKDVIEDIVNTCDIMGICGNGALYGIEEEAGARSADLVIAATDADEINLLICMLAKKLGTKHAIARVRNPEYEHQLRIMRDDFGLSMAINPEKATAREIARVLRFPTAIKLESFAKGRLELLEYLIGKGSRLDGVALADLSSSVRARVLICAVEREGHVTIPSGDFVLKEGDTIYITASSGELRNFFSHLGALRAGVSSAIIAGGSNIGYYLAKELKDAGIKFTIIDKDPARCRFLSEHFPDELVINGDASDIELLAEEGLSKTDSFVALTGIDEANILLSMYAVKHGVGKVVSKVNKRSFADLVSRGALTDTIVSPSAITADRILQYVRSMRTSPENGIRTLHQLVGGRVEAVEFIASAQTGLTGKPLSVLSIRDDILIAAIVRSNGRIVIPDGSSEIEDGDSVIVITMDKTLTALPDIVRRGGAKK